MARAKKDYSYRSTWEHKLSRARNLAQRGGLTKPEMMKRYGRFPRKNEWWGPEANRAEWEKLWIKKNPEPKEEERKKKEKPKKAT